MKLGREQLFVAAWFGLIFYLNFVLFQEKG